MTFSTIFSGQNFHLSVPVSNALNTPVPLSALAQEAPYKNIFITVKVPGFGLSGAEPGLALGSNRAARGRREPLVLAVRLLFTADTVHCRRLSFQPFPSRKSQDTVSPGHCRLSRCDKRRNSWVSRVQPAMGPGRFQRPDERAGSLRGGVLADSIAPPSPFWASSLF